MNSNTGSGISAYKYLIKSMNKKEEIFDSRPLEGIKINKEDKPLIESIKRKK